MKKMFLLVGIALFAFSCSSDNEEEQGYTPPKERTEYEVNYYISKDDIEKYPLGSRNTRLFILPKTTDQASGNSGIIVYYPNMMGVSYLVYDACCPIHWEDNDPQKHTLTMGTWDDKGAYVKCEIAYETFSLSAGRSISNITGKFVDLIKYEIDRVPLDGLQEEQGRQITNPRYKK